MGTVVIYPKMVNVELWFTKMLISILFKEPGLIHIKRSLGSLPLNSLMRRRQTNQKQNPKVKSTFNICSSMTSASRHWYDLPYCLITIGICPE